MKIATMAARISTRSFQLRFRSRTKCANSDPASRKVALERSLDDTQLPDSVNKLRIFGRAGRIANRSIEAAEDLLERIVVAFAVAARKIGITTRCRFQ